MENKIILVDSDEAANQTTIPAWISANGRIFTDEDVARHDGGTHRKCLHCGEPCLKRWLSCESCRAKQDKKTFLAMPVVEWKEDTPVNIYKSDEYFFSYDDLIDYCEENQLELADLMIVACEPIEPRLLDTDFFEECLSDDGELPDEIEKAIDEFNARVAAYPHALGWVPTKTRIEFKEKNI
jgi:hypothetical protein